VIALALLIRALELLVRFFKLSYLRGQLRITIVTLAWRVSFARIVLLLRAFPCEGPLRGTILLILTAVPHIMGILRTPMLLAQGTVLRFLVALFGDLIAERDHTFLGGITSSHASFRPFVILFGWEGLFNALKHLE
jgi:hypothetical protein